MTEETSPDLRADLEAVFDQLENDQPVERDEKGRFVSKKEEAEETKEPEEDTTAVEQSGEEEITDQGSEPEPEPAAEQPLSAPERWSAEWKAKFAALPREAQQVLLEREGEYDKGFTQKAQEAAELKKRVEPLEQILAPRRQAWAMQGMDEGRAVSQLLALSDFAAEKPLEFIRWFGQQRGIDLASLSQPGQPQAQPQGQPATAAPEIAPVLNKVQSLEQQIQQWQKAQTDRQIEDFRSAPGHEHFDEVRPEMGRLLSAGLAANLQEAYDKACRVNPTVWQKIEASKLAQAEAQRKADEAKRAAARKEAAEKAKRAAGVQVSAKASLNGGPPAPANMRESLNQAWDQIMGAA